MNHCYRTPCPGRDPKGPGHPRTGCSSSGRPKEGPRTEARPFRRRHRAQGCPWAMVMGAHILHILVEVGGREKKRSMGHHPPDSHR